MLSKIQLWFKSHNISTHTIAAMFVALWAAYNEVPEFKDFVLWIWSLMPARSHQIVLVLISLYSWYKRNRPEWTPEQRAQLLKK